MNMSTLRVFLILLVSIFYMQSLFAMRCGDQLVNEGDSEFIVQSRCGEPLDKQTYVETTPQYSPEGYQIGETSVTVDKWYYQKSRAEFLYELIFENGVLVQINANRNPS